jgi:nucleoside-diphosphate-sugar epimerase
VTPLIVGGTGMVGPGVVRAFAERGVAPFVLHRGGTAADSELPAAAVVRADRRDAEAVRRTIREHGADTVVDLACFDPEDVASLVAALPEGIRVVVVSTVSVYGPPTRDGPIHEESPCRPISDYGRAKRAVEEEIARRLPGATVVRLGACFREGAVLDGQCFEDAYWLGAMVRAEPSLLVDGGAALWNLLHADDAGRAIAALAASEEAAGETVLVASRTPHGWRRQYEWIAEDLGLPLRVVDVPSSWLLPRLGDREFLDENSLGNHVYDLSRLERLAPEARQRVELRPALARTARALVDRGELGDPELAREALRACRDWLALDPGAHSSSTTG